MSTNVINQVAYLRTSREFPEEIKELSFQVNKTYVDIAGAVNSRIIGIFSVNRPAITGEAWFLNSPRQQTLRQVYIFTTTAPIDLGFKIASISQFSPKCYGTFTDGTNWYGLIYASNVAIAGQISFFINLVPGNPLSDQIVFLVGAGAPALTKGTVLIEWLSNA